jgi:hypothetical protein
MERVTKACACGLAAIALVGVAATIAEGGSAATPKLRLIKRDPLQIKGLRFAPGERVRVTATNVTTSNTRARVVRATGRGSFSARLGRWGRCATIIVNAVGARRDRATLIVQPPSPIAVPCWGI